MHWWIAQQVAEEHRRDLTASFRTGQTGIRQHPNRAEPVLMTESVQHTGDQVVPAEAWHDGSARRAIAPSVGALLIRMGTRLGGASMRTS